MRFMVYILIAFLFYSCKKYPENNLWFKRPEKILERGSNTPWILEYYSVNDIDSTFADFLTVYKQQGIIIGEITSSYGFYTDGILQGGYSLKNKKRNIQFFYSTDNFHSNSTINSNFTNQRNILLDNELHWKIQKLCKNQFWIIATFNNIKYEMHFK